MKIPIKYVFEIIDSENLYQHLLDLLRTQTKPGSDVARGANLDMHSWKLISGVTDHLMHKVEFGALNRHVSEEGIVSVARPQYLQAWELAGCPGVYLDSLREIVLEHAPVTWEKIKQSRFKPLN